MSTAHPAGQEPAGLAEEPPTAGAEVNTSEDNFPVGTSEQAVRGWMRRHRWKSRFKRLGTKVAVTVIVSVAGVVAQEAARPYAASAINLVRQAL
jgi:hypothetical protein